MTMASTNYDFAPRPRGRRLKRGAVSHKTSTLFNFWCPVPLVRLMDECARELDLDRSKFIRLAVREKLELDGVIPRQAR